MPRIARFVRSDVPTIYHVISRTALDGFPLQDGEKCVNMGTGSLLVRQYKRTETPFSCALSTAFCALKCTLRT
jgi:hypothetical protein